MGWLMEADKKRIRRKWSQLWLLIMLAIINLYLYRDHLRSFFQKQEEPRERVSYLTLSLKSPGHPSRALPTPSPIERIPISFQEIKDEHYVCSLGPYEVIYTIDPTLQRYTQRILRRYRVPYGAVVALEPASGKILILTGYSRHSHLPNRDLTYCFQATFPAASIVKLITAAAALETNSVRPESLFRYDGNMYQVTPQKLKRWRRRDQITTLSLALAKSNNVVFARITLYLVGYSSLSDYLERFGFNRKLLDYLPMQISRAYLPRDPFELGKTGAGLGDIYMSPLHGAMIAATIAQKGEMIAPQLIEEIRDQRGRTLYRARKISLGQVIHPETALKLNRMMQETIRQGTCKKAFRDYRGRPFFPHLAISGKTGSLNGEDPRGAYHWFVGFAPSDAPRIAIAALVINSIDGEHWRIKGAHLARMVLQKFFSR